MSSTKALSVRSKLLLRSGNLSRSTLWWVTADRWLRATSAPSSKSLMYNKGEKKLFADHVTQACTAHNRVILSFLQQVQGDTRPTTRDRQRTLGTMCTCEKIERETHACRASKLGPVERWWTLDDKLGITIQDPPPESGRRTHLLYFTYSYCILSRV